MSRYSPGSGAKYCDQRVCLSVSPLAYLKKPHVQTSLNFLNRLPEAVARSCSDDNAMYYVLPVFVDDMFSRKLNGSNTDTGLQSAM